MDRGLVFDWSLASLLCVAMAVTAIQHDWFVRCEGCTSISVGPSPEPQTLPLRPIPYPNPPEQLYQLPMGAGWIYLSRVEAVLSKPGQPSRPGSWPHVDVIVTQPGNSRMDLTIWLGSFEEAVSIADCIAMARNAL